MGAVYAEVELINAGDAIRVQDGTRDEAAVRRVVVTVLADSGATVMVIPESLRQQLGLIAFGTKFVAMADGAIRECEIVGPIEVRYAGRNMVGTAVVMPEVDQILLGQVQMEEMDLVIDPLARKLIANPTSPDRATLMAVGLRVRDSLPPVP